MALNFFFARVPRPHGRQMYANAPPRWAPYGHKRHQVFFFMSEHVQTGVVRWVTYAYLYTCIFICVCWPNSTKNPFCIPNVVVGLKLFWRCDDGFGQLFRFLSFLLLANNWDCTGMGPTWCFKIFVWPEWKVNKFVKIIIINTFLR